MKLMGSYLKNESLKVLFFIITGFPGNLMFPHYLLKVENAAPEPSPGHTLLAGDGTKTRGTTMLGVVAKNLTYFS